MANDRLAVFDLIKSKTRELGEEGFIQWWHGLDDSGFRVIQNALRDPGFKLRPEQRLPEGHWRTCFWRTGRGWGKTFAASSAAKVPAQPVRPKIGVPSAIIPSPSLAKLSPIR